jgi:hypothetical protein
MHMNILTNYQCHTLNHKLPMAGLIKEEGTEERALSTVEVRPGLNLKTYHQALHT